MYYVNNKSKYETELLSNRKCEKVCPDTDFLKIKTERAKLILIVESFFFHISKSRIASIRVICGGAHSKFYDVPTEFQEPLNKIIIVLKL